MALGLLALAAMVVVGPLQATAAASYVTTSGTKLMYQSQPIVLRGVNFNNEPALACCGGPDISLINANQSDYAQAHSLGVNHLRWGIDYNWYATNRTQFFSALDQHMAWAAQYQLWVYLVDFIPPGGSSGGFDQSAAKGYCIWSDCATSGANQTLLNNMWQDIATHYANNPTIVGYDVMNEPAPPADSEWHSLATRLYNTLTAADPNHLVIIEAPLSNDLSLFTQTSRVIYSVHHYPGGDNFPTGTPANTPMIVGEFGDVRTSSTAVSFVSSEVSRYNAAGVSWTYFVWREDPAGFGLYVDPAGSFTSPWTAMIGSVQTGWAGNVLPAPVSGTPPPSPSPSPTASPSPTPSPPPPSSGLPTYDHIFQIMMENHSYNEVIGQPYITSLTTKGAVAGNYFAVDHPSLPNYLALTSAQDPAFASSDCAPAPGCDLGSTNLADTIESSGRTWKSYNESMAAGGASTCRPDGDNLYDVNHNPFMYYTDITNNATRCNSHVVDYSTLAGDLSSAATTPNYVYLNPNLQDDMHDGTIAQGDTWLSQNVPALLSSPAFTTQHSLLIVMWDEDDGSQNNQVAFIALGYNVKTAYNSAVLYNHYSWLKTIESSWGLTTMTSNDGTASPMTDLFGTGSTPSLSASASASRNAGDAPVTVAFTGSASGGTAPYTYAWAFGDGGSAAGQNPSHTYSVAGTYSAVLTGTDAAGHSAAAGALTITVSPALSVSDSASTNSGNAPLSVNFTSTPRGGLAPYRFAWTFGDGASATSQNPAHTYSAAGTYGSNLTVTDANGATANASALTIIVNGPLSTTASASPLAGDAPATVDFTVSALGGTTPYSFTWSFGDGATSTSQNPSHTYSAAGSYSAVVTVTDGAAATLTRTLTVVISPTLTASSSASVGGGAVPLAVNFAGAGSGGLGSYTYSWNFGDGATSTSQNPSHTYTINGTYFAILSVTDTNGVRVSAVPLTITVTPAITASTSALPGAGDAPLTVAFTGTPNGGTPPYTYTWAFGDGSTSTTQNPSHTYSSVGIYSAVLTVTDSRGAHAAASALSIAVNPLPSASASASRTAGDAPVTVNFTGSVSGGTAPYSYAWTFGDGASATGQNPSHVYSSAGSFSVNLTVTDAAAHIAVAIGLTITVSPALSVSDGASSSAGNAPLAVIFTSTPSGGLAPYGYAWSFGDGATATTQSPTHDYSAAGIYTANLTVTDRNGGTASASALIITVHGPLSAAASASPLAGDVPLIVAFTGVGAGGAPPYSYAWTFGDGASSTAQNPSHIYIGAGTFTATLTITDSSNLAATATATATVVVSPSLVASASASPSAGAAPLGVNFTGTTSGGLGPFNYAWNFGDGSSSTLQSPSHTYALAGTYTVNLSVTDANQVRASSTPLTITALVPLSAGASAGPRSGDAPLVVAFTGTASGGTSPYAYAWTFGDGNTSTSQSPSHTYSVGSYSATLTVTDALGARAIAGTITITVSPALGVGDSASTGSGNAPLAVTFTSTPSGGLPPYSYVWTFGDGASANSQNPNHTYSAAGTYNANLTITDANRATASATNLVINVNGALAAAAGASARAGDAPMTVSFTGTPSGGSAPFSYAWTLGDGSSSSSQNPSHTYTAAGTYSVTLTITDNIGAKASASALTITVNPQPSVTAAADRSAGDAPLTVAFTATGTGGTPPLTFSWTFGDGGTSTAQQPSHTYASSGAYIASLSVTDATGRTALASPLAITVSPALSASDSASTSVGNAPLAVSFTSTSSGGLPPYSYAWTFGDGAGSTIQSPSHTYTAAGTYTANLTVTDANAATASASAVSITVIGPLSAVATASPGTGDAPFTTTLNASTTGGTSPYAFAWDLGDGSTSTAKSPDHVYSSAGTYTATVSVSDGSAQVAHSSVRVTVYTAMSVSVTASPAVGVAPVQVNFAVGASGGLAPYTFAWDYGDGIAGPGASTTHSYAAGTFHPTVTVHDAAGGTWSGSAGTISVTAPPAAQQPPPAPAPPAAPLPSPSTAPTSSPPGEPSAPPSVSTPTAPAAAPNAPSGSGALPGTGLLLMLIGSLFVTGLGGALFLGWLRRRA